MHYNQLIRTAGPGQRRSETQRFWSKVEKTDECWNWVAAKNEMGYGVFGRNGKTEKAHRVAYSWSNGPIRPSEWLDHKCRNKSCVRPSHLRIATPKQNGENLGGASRNNLTSGVRGVYAHRNGRWQVRVQHNGKSHSGGLFDTIEAAEEAAVALRNKLFTHNDLDRQQRRDAA